ncbi:hypothetical protein BJ508DRAFT_362299 [Ascobolus immersus RN42]|uniref:Uncharacterized protein n=1 Tax=Ascobolus immersus RN42 TaxID=1160509 RepID=A0A3N4I887_ASCIM|nr:hypothetical protein BJ508DRAFT_362299 [Ascobolus immersus RN42]
MPRFTVPRTRTAPNHPSNSPCPMRPWSPWIEQPFFYHPNRSIRPQRISFYDLPYEIHMMIFNFVVSKETRKFPMPYEVVNAQMDQEADDEALMAEAMDVFLFGADEAPDQAEMAEMPDDQVDQVVDNAWVVELANHPLAVPDTVDVGAEALPSAAQLELLFNHGQAAAMAAQATAPAVTTEEAPVEKKPKSKKITYPTDNAYELLRSAQKRPSNDWKLDPDKYLNTDDIWGMLSLVRTCRSINATFTPKLLKYLVNTTYGMYLHEVNRMEAELYYVVKADPVSTSNWYFFNRKEPLVYWDQIEEDENRADEEANPEGYRGLTPFNQFAGHEYDEWEMFVHKEDEYDWNGMLSGCTELDWSDPWHMNALIFTACHDEAVMGDFLRGYIKFLKKYDEGKWWKWLGRDVMLVLVRYPTFRMDPWVENLVRKEFELEGSEKRQTTLEEFADRGDRMKN